MRKFDIRFFQRVALVVALAIMVACSWLIPVEIAANEQVDAGFKRALVTFATARALNGLLSLLETTEISATPVGVGVKFSPGQLLKPVNDFVEQFSHLMLIASVAFGIEKILISIGSSWMASLLLTAAAIIWSYFHIKKQWAPAGCSRILAVLLMIRFAMPIAIIGSDALFNQFMSDEYNSSQQLLDTASGQFGYIQSKTAAPAAAPVEQRGLLDKVIGLWVRNPQDATPLGRQDAGVTSLGWFPLPDDLTSKIENVKLAAKHWAENIIKLIAIFLLQTLLLPIFFLWVMWGGFKGTFEMSPSTYRLLEPRKSESPPLR